MIAICCWCMMGYISLDFHILECFMLTIYFQLYRSNYTKEFIAKVEGGIEPSRKFNESTAERPATACLTFSGASFTHVQNSCQHSTTKATSTALLKLQKLMTTIRPEYVGYQVQDHHYLSKYISSLRECGNWCTATATEVINIAIGIMNFSQTEDIDSLNDGLFAAFHVLAFHMREDNGTSVLPLPLWTSCLQLLALRRDSLDDWYSRNGQSMRRSVWHGFTMDDYAAAAVVRTSPLCYTTGFVFDLHEWL